MSGPGLYDATVRVDTPRGAVQAYRRCSAEFISRFEFDPGIGIFPQYRSIIRDKAYLSRITSLEDANVVLCCADSSRIVGYLALTYPDPRERWSKDCDKVVYELGSIEVSRHWRSLGIAEAMVRLVCADDWLEEKIAILTGYSWHWDLEGSGLTKAKYRGMLMRVFGSAGFRQFYTDEPNIGLDFANLFMARIGSRVGNEDICRFYDLLFANRERESF